MTRMPVRSTPPIEEIDEPFLRRHPLPLPEGESDKESRGRVVIVGGSRSAPGSVMLSGYGTLRAGAGKLQLAVPQSLASAVGVAFLEAGVVGFPETRDGEPAQDACSALRDVCEGADAVLIGPGLMDEESAATLVIGLLDNLSAGVFIIDAMALTGIHEDLTVLERYRGKIVLTPHAGEMAKLTGQTKEQVQRDPARAASELSARLSCAVVLKGATTYLATDGALFRHGGGVVGLATAGSGDVLAGVIAGLAARGASIMQACAWAVFAHAQAGAHLSRKMGTVGLIAREIADEIPVILMAHEMRG